jgi:hypothetical protein
VKPLSNLLNLINFTLYRGPLRSIALHYIILYYYDYYYIYITFRMGDVYHCHCTVSCYIAAKCRLITHSINVDIVIGHERARIFLFCVCDTR